MLRYITRDSCQEVLQKELEGCCSIRDFLVCVGRIVCVPSRKAAWGSVTIGENSASSLGPPAPFKGCWDSVTCSVEAGMCRVCVCERVCERMGEVGGGEVCWLAK